LAFATGLTTFPPTGRAGLEAGFAGFLAGATFLAAGLTGLAGFFAAGFAAFFLLPCYVPFFITFTFTMDSLISIALPSLISGKTLRNQPKFRRKYKIYIH